jgi:hypothetical protein
MMRGSYNIKIEALESKVQSETFETKIKEMLRATARRMVPAYANDDVQLQNAAPDDGLKSPKHVEHLMVNKDT